MNLTTAKQDRLDEAIAYAAANGFMVRANRDPTLFDHAPFTLYPTAYPSKLYKQAQSLSIPFNLLVDRVARDDVWLRATLKEAAKADPFVADQLQIYEQVMKEGIKQQTYLGIHRSDYMMHVPQTTNEDGNTNESKTETSDINILQVELNTIAASFGCLSTKVSQMHQYLRTKAQLLDSTTTNNNDELPENNATAGLANAIHAAHEHYKTQRSTKSTIEPVVLFVVQDGETNTVDQRLFEFELTSKHGVAVMRRSLTSLSAATCASLSNDAECPLLMVEEREISVVYYRAGYTPRDYPSDAEWQARLLIERSYAIKCPSIAYQLVGAKKVQQQLANSGELEKFLSVQEGCVEARNTFAGLWQVDDVSVSMVLKNKGVGYVMKPQREGGGNNIYGLDIPVALDTMTTDERSAYIFMELIQPPEIQGTMVKSGKSNINKGAYMEVLIFLFLVDIFPPPLFFN